MGTSLFRCLSVSLWMSLSSPSLCFLYFIPDLLSPPSFISLASTHASSFPPRAHTHAHKDSLAGTVSILKGLSVSISQQPCPRGCVLPTLLPREELWWSANRFPLSLSCYSAPGFTPACKINLWPSPFPRQPYPLSRNG